MPRTRRTRALSPTKYFLPLRESREDASGDRSEFKNRRTQGPVRIQEQNRTEHKSQNRSSTTTRLTVRYYSQYTELYMYM